MSYSDATLDLSAVPVACLSGQNGSGKSALLDAVTWALWECARSSSDELIRLSAREMWVDVQFIYEGHLYRVRRSRQRSHSKSGGKGITKGTLDMQVLVPGENKGGGGDEHENFAAAAVVASESTAASESATTSDTIQGAAQPNEDLDQTACCSTPISPALLNRTGWDPRQGKWKSLTGSSMRETQKYICDLIRMDYDTFVNSAYLRQGKADEFTMRSSSERKQVLGEILGLSYFDRLQEQAREKVRHLKARKELLDISLQAIPDLEEKVTSGLRKKDEIEALLSNAAGELEEQEKVAAEVNERIHLLLLKKQRANDAEQRTADLKSDIDRLTTELSFLESKLSGLDELIEQSSAIEAEASRLDRCRNTVAVLDEKARLFHELINERMTLQTQLATMRSRLEVECEHAESVLAEAESRLSRLTLELSEKERIEESYAQYKDLVAKEMELSRKQEAHTQLTNRIGELHSAVAEARIRLEAEISQKQTSLSELILILESRPLLDEQKTILESESNTLDRLEAQFELIEQKGLSVKSDLESVDAQITELIRRQKENMEKISELEQHKDSSICPLCSSSIVDRAAVVNRYRTGNEEMNAEIVQLESRKNSLLDERAQLRADYAEMRKKLESRKDLDKQIGQFNEKIVALQRAEENRDRLAASVKLLEMRLEKLDFAQLERESLIALKAELHKLDFDPVAYASVQSQLRAQRHIESKYNQLKKDEAESARLQQALPTLRYTLEKTHSELSSETYGEEIRIGLKDVQEKISALGYDRDEHTRETQLLTKLMPSADRLRQLEQARGERPELESSLENCRLLHNGKIEQLDKLSSEVADSEEVTKELPELNERQLALQPRLRELKEVKEKLAQQKAVAFAQLEHHERELATLVERKNEGENLDAEIDDYQFLAESFGKKGIQAVIIENAIPEIETDANRILARLTDNKMHIALETQHRTKAGSVVETLDLLIGDEIGTRNYELYSGGEAFKVNFAVRVALSRLLTRRAGAKLETLIIDEGFGSQDESSRERLVRAIRSIQSDFARILVVTHMTDIKDMFPTQIQVTKQNGTSRLQVVA